MPRYFMTPITYNRFKTMGYDLNCRLCPNPIKPFDEVESKASGSGNNENNSGPKLYHAECYDGAHESIEYDQEYLMNIYEEDGLEDLKQIFWEFELDAPEGLSAQEYIDMILELDLKWSAENRNA